MEFTDREIAEYAYRYNDGAEVCAIILVGSNARHSGNAAGSGSDIDLFVITDSGRFQKRKIVKTDCKRAELDINYFPKDIAHGLVEAGEAFMVCELAKRARILKDSENIAKALIAKAKARYDIGPERLESQVAAFEKLQAKNLMERIKREDDYAQGRLTGIIAFEKIIKAYFAINGIWQPKEKAMLRELRNISPELYKKSVEFIEDFQLSKLEEIHCEVFKEVTAESDIELVYFT